MGDNDWNSVVWTNNGRRSNDGNKSQQLNKAFRSGGDSVQTSKRYGAGKNAASEGSTLRTDDDAGEEGFKHATVTMELRKMLQQERMKAKMSQKELATMCNVKAQIIQAYEAGKAIPNSQFLGKVERALRQKNPEFQMGTLTKAQKGKGKAKAKPKAQGAVNARKAVMRR